MTGPAPQLIGIPAGPAARQGRVPGGAGWLDWLRAHLDPVLAAGRMGRRREAVHR